MMIPEYSLAPACSNFPVSSRMRWAPVADDPTLPYCTLVQYTTLHRCTSYLLPLYYDTNKYIIRIWNI